MRDRTKPISYRIVWRDPISGNLVEVEPWSYDTWAMADNVLADLRREAFDQKNQRYLELTPRIEAW